MDMDIEAKRNKLISALTVVSNMITAGIQSETSENQQHILSSLKRLALVGSDLSVFIKVHQVLNDTAPGYMLIIDKVLCHCMVLNSIQEWTNIDLYEFCRTSISVKQFIEMLQGHEFMPNIIHVGIQGMLKHYELNYRSDEVENLKEAFRQLGIKYE